MNFDFSNYYSAESFENKYGMNLNIKKTKSQVFSRKKLSDEAKDILNLLLKKDPEDRIEPEQIIYHPFFSRFNYSDYKNKKIESPLKSLINKINFPKYYFDDSGIYKGILNLFCFFIFVVIFIIFIIFVFSKQNFFKF